MTASSLAPAPQPRSVPEQDVSAVKPAVSVIITTYNSGPLIVYALNALQAQSLPAGSIEILVVDDGSTDDTWRHLSELAASRSCGNRTPVVPALVATGDWRRRVVNSSSSMMPMTTLGPMHFGGFSIWLANRTPTSWLAESAGSAAQRPRRVSSGQCRTLTLLMTACGDH